METEQTYHKREMQVYYAQASERERAPLSDRREAKAEFAKLLADTESLGRRAEFLLGGAFGYGQQFVAKQIIEETGKRAQKNKVARISILIALWECSCPCREAIAAWKSLTDAQRKDADAAIRCEIDYRLRMIREESEAAHPV